MNNMSPSSSCDIVSPSSLPVLNVEVPTAPIDTKTARVAGKVSVVLAVFFILKAPLN